MPTETDKFGKQVQLLKIFDKIESNLDESLNSLIGVSGGVKQFRFLKVRNNKI